jgi:hypothetical protein
MAIRSTLVGTPDKNSIDAARTVTHELRRIKSALVNVSTAPNQTSIINLLTTIDASLTTIDTNISSLLTSTDLANWTLVAGNSIEYSYYTGIAPGNPSGSTSNVETIVYKQGATIIITQTISYNASDLAISIITT